MFGVLQKVDTKQYWKIPGIRNDLQPSTACQRVFVTGTKIANPTDLPPTLTTSRKNMFFCQGWHTRWTRLHKSIIQHAV